jgi:threonine dehydratase
MPESAPLTKLTSTRGYGARVILHGDSLRDARHKAEEIAAGEGRIYVPPFDDDRIIAGQGTLGLELLEQAPEATEILVPTGGGGLLAGVATAVKSRRPDIRIIGVQTEAMNGAVRSFAAGEVIETGASHTIADGCAVSGPSERTLALIRRHVDAMIVVPEAAIARAVLLLIEQSRMVVEGAGALAAAALLAGIHRPNGPCVAVLSGGNIDITLLGAIVRKGLVEAGRYQHLSLLISDRPGQLSRIAGIIADGGGNIINVVHDREARGLALGAALLDLVVEVDGEDHFAAIVHDLTAAGFLPGQESTAAV